MTVNDLLSAMLGEVKITISQNIINGETTTVDTKIILYSGGESQLSDTLLAETVKNIEIQGRTRMTVWLNDLDITPGPETIPENETDEELSNNI